MRAAKNIDIISLSTLLLVCYSLVQMAFISFVLIALLFSSFTSSYLLPRGNVTTGLPPLKQGKKQGSGVLKIPISKASPTPFSKRQDSNPLENVNNGYLITCTFISPQIWATLTCLRFYWNSTTACVYTD